MSQPGGASGEEYSKRRKEECSVCSTCQLEETDSEGNGGTLV